MQSARCIFLFKSCINKIVSVISQARRVRLSLYVIKYDDKLNRRWYITYSRSSYY